MNTHHSMSATTVVTAVNRRRTRSKITSAALVAAAGLALLGSSAQAGTIYADNFGGSSSAGLDGTTPTTTTGGNKWVAAQWFNADGSYQQTGSSTSSGGSATLAFTPTNNHKYTLQATASLTGYTSGGAWIALGFANGQSSAASYHNRFINGDVIGVAWMFYKTNGSGSSYLSDAATTVGNTYGTSWPFTTTGTTVDYRIMLDTTGGTGNWTATWYAKNPSDSQYTEVQSATSLTSDAINSVGFALDGDGATGTLSNFSLTEVSPTPEPASLAILGLGGLLFVGKRRRQRIC